jgi:hypothetical protein
MVEGALEQKKEDWSKIQRKNTKIRGKNMFPPSQKLGTASANMWHGRATLQSHFCCFFFKAKLPCCSFTVLPF